MSAIGQPKELPVISKTRSQQVMAHCELSFVEQIGGGFNSQLDGVLEHIRNAGFQATSYQDKQLYSELHHAMMSKRHEMGIEFKIFLKKFFKEKFLSQDNLNVHELALVSDDEEEQIISQKRLEKNLSESLGDELSTLSIRMEYLLGEDKNPFTPDVLAKALASTLDKIIDDNKLQKQAINVFAQAWPVQVKSTYQGINSYLVANDVIPDVKNFQVKKNKNSVDSSSHTPSPHSNSYNHPNINAGRESAPLSFGVPNLDTFFSKLNQEHGGFASDNQQGNAQSDKNIVNNHELPDLSQLKINSEPSNADFKNLTNDAVKNFYHLLAQMNENQVSTQQEVPAYLRKPVLKTEFKADHDKVIEQSLMLSNQQLMKSINDLQSQFLQLSMAQALAPSLSAAFSSPIIAHRNVLTELAETQKNAQLSPESAKQVDPQEQIIVDLLSLMFDKIFAHPKLPEHIKYLIGKLQIPILKASILDKTFFIYKDNAVRLFLDCLATSNTLYNTEYHNKFEEIINHVLLQEEITQRTFAKALEQIQTMLQEYENKENKFIENISPSLEIDEKADDYYEQVLQYISKSSSRAHYEPVKSFMEKVWAKAFAKKWTSLVSPTLLEFMKALPLEAKVTLHQSMLIFDMMIWSTNLKDRTDVNIEKLKSFVPKIGDGLKRVCTDLNISAEDFHNLSYLLAQRHIAMMRSEKPQDLEKNFEKITGDEKRILKTFDAKIEQTQQIKVATKEIAASKSNFEEVFLKGTWFEFSNDKTKMRLMWVSPQKTIFLFNNPENKKVYRFDKSKVWSYFKSKHLTPIALEDTTFNSSMLIEDAVEAFKNQHNATVH